MSKNQIDPETNLNPRQRNLLFALIKEFCEFGTSLGSKELKEKYGFDFSPATIRNEMAYLRDLGYLYQPFTNASNQPTEKAFKIFINQLIVGLQVTSRQHQELKKQIFEMEEKQVNLQKEISRLLAFDSGGVGFTLDKNNENISGVKNLLTSNKDGKITDILDFLDNLDNHKKYLLEHPKEQQKLLLKGGEVNQEQHNNLQTIIGSENPVVPLGQGYAMLATEVYIDNQKTVVGLITPIHVLARKKNLELVQALGSVLGKTESEKPSTKKAKKS